MTASPRVTITPAMVKADARGRIARTAGQGGVAAAVVTIGDWIASDLAHLYKTMPTPVAGAFVVVFAALGSWAQNRTRLRGVAS